MNPNSIVYTCTWSEGECAAFILSERRDVAAAHAADIFGCRMFEVITFISPAQDQF